MQQASTQPTSTQSGDRIRTHLPYLRRYARALSGSQESGDRYAQATLEALVEGGGVSGGTGGGASTRAALFKAFNAIWQSVSVNMEGAEAQVAGERNVSMLTPRSRQAFLLTSVEGFAPDEAAFVLDVTPDELSRLVAQAGHEIAEQVATSVLIIEDEPLIAMDIEQLVEQLGHEVTGIARTRDEAARLLKEREPGLVLADIQLADGSSGIDAVNDILKSVNVPVIFITAFPDRLLTGERPEPAFQITKPFHPDMVKAMVSQALFFDKKAGAGT